MPKFIIVTAIPVDDADVTTRIAIRSSIIERVLEVPILKHTQIEMTGGSAFNVTEGFDEIMSRLLSDAD